MFCNQCEQTAKGEGCTKAGVCGKPHDVATLQDLLVYALIGLSIAASEARRKGIDDHDADVFTVKALFSTLTNVNFDPDRFVPMIKQAVTIPGRAHREGQGLRREPRSFQGRPDLQAVGHPGRAYGPGRKRSG